VELVSTEELERVDSMDMSMDDANVVGSISASLDVEVGRRT
jgi:hypothetical protein